MPLEFTIEARQDQARTGQLQTAHGQVDTPAFMPVGTQASVKGLTPEQIRRTGEAHLEARADERKELRRKAGKKGRQLQRRKRVQQTAGKKGGKSSGKT